jgi:hypothetical protein
MQFLELIEKKIFESNNNNLKLLVRISPWPLYNFMGFV